MSLIPHAHSSLSEIVESLRGLNYRCHRAERAVSASGWHPVWMETQQVDNIDKYHCLTYYECANFRILRISFEHGQAFFDVYDSLAHALDECPGIREIPELFIQLIAIREEAIKKCEDLLKQQEDD